MSTEKQKARTLYHSELVKLGTVTVTVKSDVLKSKFQGKPNYCYLQLNGEERGYSFDSQDCEDFFKGQKGRTMTIKASGREDSAAISYVGEGQDAPPPAPAAPAPAAPTQAPRQAPPPPQNHSHTPPPSNQMDAGHALNETKKFAGRRLTLLKIASKAMLNFKHEWDNLPEVQAASLQMTDDQFWNKVTTLYLSLESQGLAIRGGFADALSTKSTFAEISGS